MSLSPRSSFVEREQYVADHTTAVFDGLAGGNASKTHVRSRRDNKLPDGARATISS